MKKILLIFLTLILFTSAVYAQDYRVRIFSLEKKIYNIKIRPVGDAYVRPLEYNNPITANCRVIFTVNGKTKEIYCKNIYLKKDNIIITTDVENLTSAVTLSEVHAYNFPEYIKAQAVCARSYIMSARGKHKEDSYDFCDSTCCQAINGKPMRADLVRIIKSTAGEYLCYKNKIIPAFYHSTCGGVTAGAEDVFLEQINGVVSVKDTLSGRKKDLCAYSPHYIWKFIIGKDKLRDILNNCGINVGNYLPDIQITMVKNGRVKKMKFFGQKMKTISGYDFYLLMGNKLGWGSIESTFFGVKKDKDNFIFTGRGLGHGIGLCQYGAFNMAQLGYKYKDILKHYFPMAEIRSRD